MRLPRRLAASVVGCLAAVAACRNSTKPTEQPLLILSGVPDSVRLHVNGVRQLTVEAKDASRQDSNIPITYSSADPTVASVTPAGLITALKSGTTKVSLHVQAASADIPIHVLNEPLTSVVASPSVTGCPYEVAVTSGNVGYVTSICGSTVYRFDAATRTLGAAISVGAAPAYVAMNPTGTVAYVVNQVGQSVSVIDVASSSVVGTIPLAGSEVYHLKVSPDGARLYVTRQDGVMYVINTATRTTITTVSVGFGANGIV